MAEPTAPPPGRPAGLAAPPARPAGIVVPAAAAMAVGMGVGRFVYTPILPLMAASAGLSPRWGAAIATANYAGYLAGAMAGVAAPALLRSRAVYRSSLIVVVLTLALMPVLTSDASWAALRFVAGCASALVFMVAASALLTGLRAHGEHLVGHGFGGVGAGIAASGVLVLVLRHGTWQDSWWSAAVLGAVLSAAAWPLRPSATDGILVPMDRGGNPSFNPILNPEDIKDEFNSTDPVDDVKNYLQPLSEALRQHGYSPDEATAAARTLLPDILHYDRTMPVRYPNGRVMTDDVFSHRMIFMTHGRANPQGVRPHDDLLARFPYLGPPNP